MFIQVLIDAAVGEMAEVVVEVPDYHRRKVGVQKFSRVNVRNE
jgi:hypothetical protein